MLYLKPSLATWALSIHLFHVGRRPVGFAFATIFPYPAFTIWSRLIDIASARRKALSLSGFFVVLGTSQAVFAESMNGAFV